MPMLPAFVHTRVAAEPAVCCMSCQKLPGKSQHPLQTRCSARQGTRSAARPSAYTHAQALVLRQELAATCKVKQCTNGLDARCQGLPYQGGIRSCRHTWGDQQGAAGQALEQDLCSGLICHQQTTARPSRGPGRVLRKAISNHLRPQGSQRATCCKTRHSHSQCTHLLYRAQSAALRGEGSAGSAHTPSPSACAWGPPPASQHSRSGPIAGGCEGMVDL